MSYRGNINIKTNKIAIRKYTKNIIEYCLHQGYVVATVVNGKIHGATLDIDKDLQDKWTKWKTMGFYNQGSLMYKGAI